MHAAVAVAPAMSAGQGAIDSQVEGSRHDAEAHEASLLDLSEPEVPDAHATSQGLSNESRGDLSSLTTSRDVGIPHTFDLLNLDEGDRSMVPPPAAAAADKLLCANAAAAPRTTMGSRNSIMSSVSEQNNHKRSHTDPFLAPMKGLEDPFVEIQRRPMSGSASGRAPPSSQLSSHLSTSNKTHASLFDEIERSRHGSRASLDASGVSRGSGPHPPSISSLPLHNQSALPLRVSNTSDTSSMLRRDSSKSFDSSRIAQSGLPTETSRSFVHSSGLVGEVVLETQRSDKDCVPMRSQASLLQQGMAKIRDTSSHTRGKLSNEDILAMFDRPLPQQASRLGNPSHTTPARG